MLKIAFFSSSSLTYGGGAEKYFIDIAKNLDEMGAEVRIFTIDKNLRRKLCFLYSIYYLKIIKIFDRETEISIKEKLGKIKWTTGSLSEIKNQIMGFDVIYAKNEILDLVLLRIMGLTLLPPIVAGVHTPIFIPITHSLHSKIHNLLYFSFIYHWLLKGISLIHVANKDDEILVEDKFSIPVKMINHPFACPEVLKKDLKKIFPDSRTFNVLFVGRLIEQKGIDIFLKIVEELSQEKEYKNMAFRIVGMGDNKLIQEAVAHFCFNFKNVRYLGHIPNLEINSQYQWSDVVIIPSRHETVNYVALEAGVNKKIVVASNIPGPREVIRDKSTGFLLKLSVEEFAQKILELYFLKKKDNGSFLEYGENARKFIEKKFNPGKIYQDLFRMFKEAANRK